MIVLTNWLQNPNAHDETTGTVLGLLSRHRHVAGDSTISMTALGTYIHLCLLAHAEKHRPQPSAPVW
jgi:hypothetical protein